MKIIVRLKNVYGNELVYPADDKAKTFASMVGQKTLSNYHLNCIRSLGYTVEVEAPKLVGAA